MRTLRLGAFGSSALLYAACSSAPPAPATTPPITGITVSSGDLVPAFDPGTTDYELTSASTLAPITVTPVGQDVTIAGASATQARGWTTTLTSLDDNSEIDVLARTPSGAPITYRIHLLPQGRPRFVATVGPSPAPGRIYLAPFQFSANPPLGGVGWLYILDERGALLYYQALGHPAFDFKRQVLPDGTVRYTYLQHDGSPVASDVIRTSAVILDEQLRPLQTIQLLPTNLHGADALDAHEFLLLGDQHWIVESYELETIPNVNNLSNVGVVGAVIQEVDHGQVVFDWDSTRLPELFNESTDGGTYGTTPYVDYAHMNSIDLDPTNGNLLVSFRHLDEVLELDRKTGAIVWKLGGKGDQFGLSPDAKSSHQHDVRFLEAGHLIMFDNGNATKTTNIREYQIDPVTHVATNTVTFGFDNHYSLAMGSVQKLGGHYFIGWGYRGTTDSDITEIDPATQIKSFELTLDPGWGSYRARKL